MVDVRIIMPTWNESENIVELLNRICKVMTTTALNYEVVVVDDNSPDRTADLAVDYGKEHGHVKVIKRGGRAGYGSAFKDGLKYAVKEPNTLYVVTMDADLSHQPEDIPRLLEVARSVDIVQGSRYIRGGAVRGRRLYRWLVSLVANLIARAFFRTGMKEHTTSFRVFSSEAARLVADRTRGSGYEWLIEALLVAKKHRFKITEVPIAFVDREKGKSKMGISDIVRWLGFVINYQFRGIKAGGR